MLLILYRSFPHVRMMLPGAVSIVTPVHTHPRGVPINDLLNCAAEAHLH